MAVAVPLIAAAASSGAVAYSALKKMPKPPGLVKTPSTEDKAVQQAAAEATARRSKGLGFRGTILSQMGSQSNGLKDTIGA